MGKGGRKQVGKDGRMEGREMKDNNSDRRKLFY